MAPDFRSTIQGLRVFLRTPTISRTIVGLLSLAIVLLLLINIATFVMVQRMSENNATAERSQQMQLAARELMLLMVDAETGQRGFLLTGRQDFLAVHDEAQLRLPQVGDELTRLADTPEETERVETLRELKRRRLEVMNETIQMARAGRIGEAVQVLRRGEGKAFMDEMRQVVADIDAIEQARIDRRKEAARIATWAAIGVNGISAVLIIALAVISLMLIRRYVAEVQSARDNLDELNRGLEATVMERTADLTRANEEIQRFAYIVSHDLRAPLVNVMGYTSELEQAGKALSAHMERTRSDDPDSIEQDAVQAVEEDVPEAIGFIRASTAKMDRLINAILKLSREGRRALVPERLDMTGMVQQIADSVRHQTEEADAEIVVQDLPELESDRLSVEQIFGNLIDNAVKYLDDGRPGRIEISGRDMLGGWVEYEIVDNGRGISDRDHERIFELFRRSGRQDRTGEGLGLAFVRNSVRRLGGTIDIESELGKGSTFRLKFPKRLIAGAGDTV
ncbi:sensor histidine kinase [Brevundimonas sp.]|uniref:sensor histidine kinase n=1 Tax=Brevundimonas sp. TaxID=1871086 RepID=UPI0039E2BDE3